MGAFITIIVCFFFVSIFLSIFDETEEQKQEREISEQILREQENQRQELERQRLAEQQRIDQEKIEKQKIEIKRIELERKIYELEKLANIKIASWRSSIKVGDYSSYGLIIGIKDATVAQIQTAHSVKWYRIDELYNSTSVEHFINSIKSGAFLNQDISYLEKAYENAFIGL
jgi:hypothetical protein